jgi:hypothetical protein
MRQYHDSPFFSHAISQDESIVPNRSNGSFSQPTSANSTRQSHGAIPCDRFAKRAYLGKSAMKIATLGVVCVLAFMPKGDSLGFETGWEKSLSEKEAALERNILRRHNILGLYPSMVEIPLEGGPVDPTTASPFSDVVHAVAWTSQYLAGASYRYAWLKENGATAAAVEAARLRADEIFEAVYRCQRVTGRRGLLARGYFIGFGPTFDERRDAGHRDDWHQGRADGYDLRFCAGPSHHIYSAAAVGMGQYYDLAATGGQKERAREAVDALVSYWVDNDYKIAGYDQSRPPFSILGFTDGKTLNTRVMMAISAAKIAHHVSGNEKFLRAYEDLLERYSVRGLESFEAEKDYDDAHHIFAHLDMLMRIEQEPALRAAYGVIADGLWRHYRNEGRSLTTYIYHHLRPDAEGRAQALRAAHRTLATWPADMTIQPLMSSLDPALSPPYPIYATGWDNEYIWKGTLQRPDSHTSRIASDLSVSAQNPRVACVVDPAGHLYLAHDGGATAGGWKSIGDGLTSPVRAVAFGPKTRMIAVACDDGFFLSTTGAEAWSRLPLDYKGSPRAVWIGAQGPAVLHAATDLGIYRSLDYGEEMTGRAWESLGERLPGGVEYHFQVAAGAGKTRIYASAGADVFATTGNGAWAHAKLGLGEYGQIKGWLAVDPNNPDHAVFGVRFGGIGSFPVRTVLQETSDGGASWSANHEELTAAFYAGTLANRLEDFPAGDFKDLRFLPGHSAAGAACAVDTNGTFLVRAGAGGPWTPVMAGLDIPRVERLFVPPHGERIYAATPAGLYHLRRGETTWHGSNLVMQWRRNERRELGGASFITAYWRGLYYGFLDDDKIRADYDTGRDKGWFNQ